MGNMQVSVPLRSGLGNTGIYIRLTKCILLVIKMYLAGLVGFDIWSSDHERNSDVELVELPFIQRQRELT